MSSESILSKDTDKWEQKQILEQRKQIIFIYRLSRDKIRSIQIKLVLKSKKGSKEFKASFILWNLLIFRDPAGIQTLDLQNRNLTLYSAKLRDRDSISACKGKHFISYPKI